MPDYFLNCDWGTTRFRLRLIDFASGQVVRQSSSDEGVARLARETNSSNRPRRFEDVLLRHVQTLAEKTRLPLDDVPIVISGMASSSMGWLDLSYARLPFSLSGQGLHVCRLPAMQTDCRPIWLVSGVRADSDVMRGEEVELVGLGQWLPQSSSEQESFWTLLPGTHSKHALIEDGWVTQFQTHMTGELYQLLREHSSLLPPDLPLPGDLLASKQAAIAFDEGVQRAQTESLTSVLFQVRVGQLLAGKSSTDALALLSGLLIGMELAELVRRDDGRRIVLCAGKSLCLAYRLALESLELTERTTVVPPADVERLSALGQRQLLRLLDLPAGQSKLNGPHIRMADPLITEPY